MVNESGFEFETTNEHGTAESVPEMVEAPLEGLDTGAAAAIEPEAPAVAAEEPVSEPLSAESVEAESAGAEPAEAEPAGAEIDSSPESEAQGVEAQEADSAEPAAQTPEKPTLVLPLADMTPEERFRATTRLIFLAPDVPLVQPRQRRSENQRGENYRGDFHRGDSHRGDYGRGEYNRGEYGRGEYNRGEFNPLDDLLDQQFSRGNQTHDEDDDRESGSSRRRNRRRVNGDSSADTTEERRPAQRQAQPITEPQKVKGSTRLEAKKQRRRDGRDAGRRRRLVITESEFLARREAVDREMVVRTTADRIQIGVLEDKVLVEHYVARSSEISLIGNVYLGRVQNVLPSMEAAFVDIGRGRNAVLYSGEVDWSEYEGSASSRKIENVLKPGDQVLVQVTKDPVGHKGARLTSQISLPGRFLVYVPGGAMNGISRKLPDTERARLKKILKEVLPTGAGVIVRTAAEGASEDQLTTDVQRLTRQWESIQQRVEKGGGPVLLHSEPDMLIKIVRDVFNEDFHRIVVSGEETFSTIANYLSQVAPDLLERAVRYTDERDIFDEYRVSEQIIKALDRKVWLPSGGSLVIDRTEAMTVVDVNTGKFVGSGGNLEETVTMNNLEAAEEIVRQLRLRDIGGIIVVDFIDMVLESNRDLVLRRLVECLSRDRTKHQVAEVTSLGLVQMTRKKLGLGLLESFSEPCDVCAGRGVIVHHDPVHKHRGNEQQQQQSSRTRRNGAASGKAQNQNAQQAQTHTINDGAKNMLAKVAASTIVAPAKTADEKETESAEAPASATQASASGVAEVGSPTLPTVAPVQLLDAVLDALPAAPAAGTGRAKNRRVTTAPVRGGQSAASNDALAAQAALAEALDATMAERDRS